MSRILPGPQELTLDDIDDCFHGGIPGVLCTADAEGIPNVIYVSRVHRVDDERVAVSNQFLSKTARNLAVNPQGSMLLIDPITHDEYRLHLSYERTERRGPVFERLRADVDALAALSGMQDVFRLRAADIYRVVEIEHFVPNPLGAVPVMRTPRHADSRELASLAEVAARLARVGELDDLLDLTLESLDHLLGYRHTYLLLADAEGRRLSTVASRGFDGGTIGTEEDVGTGLVGLAAARCQAARVGNLHQFAKYSRSVRTGFEQVGTPGLGPATGLPGRPDAESILAVPIQARGHLLGMIVAESTEQLAFEVADEHLLTVVAAIVGHAIDHLLEPPDEAAPSAGRPMAAATDPAATDPAATDPGSTAVTVRFYEQDGSAFLDGEYLIRGVAGRILWALLGHHRRDGRTEFTNKELRLDPSLDLPGFKDNLESRLLLLRRRLDEHDAPIRIERTGRGRFRLRVDRPVDAEMVAADPAPD